MLAGRPGWATAKRGRWTAGLAAHRGGVPLPGERLDRFLVRTLGILRAEVHRAVHAKRISINGMTTQRYHQPLGQDDRVACDGVDLPELPDRSVLVCHKPAGLACSHAPRDAPLIYGIVPAALAHPGLVTVGRLDRSTTGLLLLTCDGGFLQRVADPARKLPKRYRVAYEGELPADAVERCAAGLVIEGYETPCAPAQLSIDAPGRATLVLREGRHHQVKRMIAALGSRVVALHRDRIGGLDLPADLAPGGMRILAPEERRALFASGEATGTGLDGRGVRA